MAHAYMELLLVLAFAAGWLVLEYVCHRLDRQKEERKRADRDARDP